MKNTLTALAIAAAFAGSSVAMAAPAPQQAAQNQQMAAQQQNIEITDSMLEKFLAAMNAVQKISSKYAEEFQNAQDAEQAQSIQQQAQEEMIGAVNDSGLSPQEYNAIVQRVQQDEELRTRLEAMTE
ncbi:hypothetical protein IDSA_08005 [Pseudidiomarina salinarum]|uniref:DUF4168 domain-containing protein n=1 Tax=Pseudidiomarina salinarum TaxID=435908 RepID=A0A094IYT2_9GAMM|nr:DUF4168 domain-containing protein [Pseudidiomarina salinarum]KFZ31004.1 hypothetical protein IDSA_08005 [Pseudidiomarina salinarum]RUO71489.1 DUF4168 domain-containing protein [Pseudidiomarina salinarum]